MFGITHLSIGAAVLKGTPVLNLLLLNLLVLSHLILNILLLNLLLLNLQ